MQEREIIRLRHISVKREGRYILKDISLSINENENVAIIGSNGAGKSTLVNVMCQYIHPLYSEKSERFLFGQDKWNIVELQKRLGIVNQELQYLCNSDYTVKEIVLSGFFSSIGLDFHHQVTEQMIEKAESILADYHMMHFADKRMNSLSSGETKKVLLARANIHNPKVMLLDEGNANLDLPSKKEFVSQLDRFASSGKNIILVTHDISQIIEEIERVIILKNGRIFRDGPKMEVLKESVLSEAFDTKVFVSEREGRFNAWC
ncbi:MAG: ATP-binding cassette domain-containing protein [Sphaerochaetaceae bacterium]|nr:ATP-binding cassette domain-containing protein [Sphaerochaetaceae bacterium]